MSTMNNLMNTVLDSPQHQQAMAHQMWALKDRQNTKLLMDGWSAEEVAWLARDNLKDWQIDQLIMKAQKLYGSDTPAVESKRIALMQLENIWRQPTPVNNVRLSQLHRELLIPTPPPTFGQHFQLPESAPSSAHPDNAPRRVSTPPGFPAGMSQTRPLPKLPTQARAPHPLAQSHQASNNYDYSAEYAEHIAPILYAPSITPQSLHDDPFSFNVHAQPTAVPMPDTRPATLEFGLARWYAEQVVSALIIPGRYRSCTNGTDDKIWSPEAVNWASFTRVAPQLAHLIPDLQTPAPLNPPRDPSREKIDPFQISSKHHPQVSSDLVEYISEMISKMRLEPAAIIAAVYHLYGMALHAGDGGKGQDLRVMLATSLTSHNEGIERRVATMGLLLANKWFDDAVFTNEQWAEVTGILARDITTLQDIILGDVRYSIAIPPSAWVDHLQEQYIELQNRDFGKERAGMLVLDSLMYHMEEAMPKPKVNRIPPWQLDTWYYDDMDARLEAAFIAEPEEPEELEETEEDMFDDSYFVPFTGPAPTNPLSDWTSPNPNQEGSDTGRVVFALADGTVLSFDSVPSSVGMEVEEAAVAAGLEEYEGGDIGTAAAGLEVDEGEYIGTESEDESEDEFLDYDGAKPFLPTMSEMRRTLSNTSAQSDIIVEWRDNVQRAVGVQYDHIPYTPTPPAHPKMVLLHLPIPFH